MTEIINNYLRCKVSFN